MYNGQDTMLYDKYALNTGCIRSARAPKRCPLRVPGTRTGLGQNHYGASNMYNVITEGRSSLSVNSGIQQEALCTCLDVFLQSIILIPVATWVHSTIMIPVATLGQQLAKRRGMQYSIMTAESFAVVCCQKMPAVAVTVLFKLLKFEC